MSPRPGGKLARTAVSGARVSVTPRGEGHCRDSWRAEIARSTAPEPPPLPAAGGCGWFCFAPHPDARKRDQGGVRPKARRNVNAADAHEERPSREVRRGSERADEQKCREKMEEEARPYLQPPGPVHIVAHDVASCRKLQPSLQKPGGAREQAAMH